MRDGENGVFLGGVGDRNSCTVDRIAVVISALDVYGKQIFKTALSQRLASSGPNNSKASSSEGMKLTYCYA